MAMSIDTYYHFNRILPRHWESQAKKVGYDPDRAVARIRDLIARIPNEARSLLAECKKEGSATPDLRKVHDLASANDDLAAGDAPGNVIVWHPETGKPERTIKAHLSFVFAVSIGSLVFNWWIHKAFSRGAANVISVVLVAGCGKVGTSQH